MAREEAINSFVEGLVMDLHPLSTPNTVLTDCLNGTIITYDGNEFMLQNDQGNFRLRNCRLKENFIPIGIKEYAGILYIISYNPLTTETEIGSYPSPRRIFTTNERRKPTDFTPIISSNDIYPIIDTYENLSKKAELQMYIDSSSNLNNFRLNPGDEFKLGIKNIENFPYQNLQFSILTENKELLDINITEDYVVDMDNMEDADFKKVFWEIPGWLVGKYNLAQINQFYLNIRNLNLPEFSETTDFDFNISLNTQIDISDNLFLKNEKIKEHLKIEYRFWIKFEDKYYTLNRNNGNNRIPVPDEYIKNNLIRFIDDNGKPIQEVSPGIFNGELVDDITSINYTTLSTVFFNNYSKEFTGRNKEEIVYVSAVPVLLVTDEKNPSNYVKVYYEQFRTNLELNLANINDAKEITAATNTFKYIVEDNSIMITFDVEGPFMNSSQLELHYEIYKLSEVGTFLLKTNRIEDVNFFGQTTINIPFDQNFEAEDIYIMTFVFKQRVNNELKIIRCINKILITSKTLNEYYDNPNIHDYNKDVSFQQWLNNFTKFVDVSGELENESISYTPMGSSDPVEGSWPTKWIQDHEWKSNPAYNFGLNFNANYTLDLGVKTLRGKIWGNYLEGHQLVYSFDPNSSRFPLPLKIGRNEDLLISDKIYKKYTFIINNIAISAYKFTADYLSNYLGSNRGGKCNMESAWVAYYSGGDGWRLNNGVNFIWNYDSNGNWTSRQQQPGTFEYHAQGLNFWIKTGTLPLSIVKLIRGGSAEGRGATLESPQLLTGQENYNWGVYYIVMPTNLSGNIISMCIRTKNYDSDNPYTIDKDEFPTVNADYNDFPNDGRDYLIQSINQFCERCFFVRNLSGPHNQYWLWPSDDYLISDKSVATTTQLRVNSNFMDFGYKVNTSQTINYSKMHQLVIDTVKLINDKNDRPNINLITDPKYTITFNVIETLTGTQLDKHFPSKSYSNDIQLEDEIFFRYSEIKSQIDNYRIDSQREYDIISGINIISQKTLYYDFAWDNQIESGIKNMYDTFINGLYANNYQWFQFFMPWHGMHNDRIDTNEKTREHRGEGVGEFVTAAPKQYYFPGHATVLKDYKSPFK